MSSSSVFISNNIANLQFMAASKKKKEVRIEALIPFGYYHQNLTVNFVLLQFQKSCYYATHQQPFTEFK